MTSTHTGSCHCGNIVFDVEGLIERALACNCSMCARRASLLWFVPRDRLALKTPEADLGTYAINRHVIRHRFCPNCGIHVIGEAKDPRGNDVAAVNLRCIERIDLGAIPVDHHDGSAI